MSRNAKGRILVTGGAGYIGSHIVKRLREEGRDVVVIDNLSEGHRTAVGDVTVVEADFADTAALDRLFGDGVEWIVHMAAFCEVGQSMVDPGAYYRNNVTRTLALLDAAARCGVQGVVFSSSAAVYGEPDALPIVESHPQLPTNAYGETKLVIERALNWYHGAHGLRWTALRYFNAAGAHPDGSIGEDHARETHLIPLVLRATAPGAKPLRVFGDDWPTPDGTCVRDYVHVCDLADAHVRSLDAMADGRIEGQALNLGNGEGFSVRQVIDTAAEITGRMPAHEPAARRAGDPARLVASSAAARERLGWNPEFPHLAEIIRTAWEWHRNHPDGYGDRQA